MGNYLHLEVLMDLFKYGMCYQVELYVCSKVQEVSRWAYEWLMAIMLLFEFRFYALFHV